MEIFVLILPAWAELELINISSETKMISANVQDKQIGNPQKRTERPKKAGLTKAVSKYFKNS